MDVSLNAGYAWYTVMPYILLPHHHVKMIYSPKMPNQMLIHKSYLKKWVYEWGVEIVCHCIKHIWKINIMYTSNIGLGKYFFM